MSQDQIEQHVNILGWLHIVGGIFFLILGGFLFFLLTGIGAASGDPEAFPILTVVGIFIAGIMAFLGLPGLAAGYGLLKHQNWGRILAIIVAIFNLPNFPLGTAVGVYTLYVLLQSEAGPYFTEQSKLA